VSPEVGSITGPEGGGGICPPCPGFCIFPAVRALLVIRRARGVAGLAGECCRWHPPRSNEVTSNTIAVVAHRSTAAPERSCDTKMLALRHVLRVGEGIARPGLVAAFSSDVKPRIPATKEGYHDEEEPGAC
jgi:hypothetical protein